MFSRHAHRAPASRARRWTRSARGSWPPSPPRGRGCARGSRCRTHLGDGRVEAGQRLAQRAVQRVHRAVALAHGLLDLALHRDLDRRLGEARLVLAALLDDDAEPLQSKNGLCSLSTFWTSSLNEASAASNCVALFSMLELLQDVLAPRARPSRVQPHLARPSGSTLLAPDSSRHQDAPLVADRLRVDVLEAARDLAHGVHVHARLVGEGALADERPALRSAAGWPSRPRTATRSRSCFRLPSARQLAAHLQRQVRDDRAQVRVAASARRSR